jgi:hypothetical protein
VSDEDLALADEWDDGEGKMFPIAEKEEKVDLA